MFHLRSQPSNRFEQMLPFFILSHLGAPTDLPKVSASPGKLRCPQYPSFLNLVDRLWKSDGCPLLPDLDINLLSSETCTKIKIKQKPASNSSQISPDWRWISAHQISHFFDMVLDPTRPLPHPAAAVAVFAVWSMFWCVCQWWVGLTTNALWTLTFDPRWPLI